MDDEETMRTRRGYRRRSAIDEATFDIGDDTSPITLVERAEADPEGPARNKDLIDLHRRVDKRVKRDTAADLSSRMTKLEFPVRIMWALFVFAAGISGASLYTTISELRASAAETATREFRLQAAEATLRSHETALHEAQIRLRDIEESARINALHIDDLQKRRAGSNPQRTP